MSQNSFEHFDSCGATCAKLFANDKADLFATVIIGGWEFDVLKIIFVNIFDLTQLISTLLCEGIAMNYQSYQDG